MKYPAIPLVLNEKEYALIKELVDAQNINATTSVREMLFAELLEPYYKRVWDKAYADYMKTEACGVLSERVADVFLSEQANKQFNEHKQDFQKLFIGWMQQQLKNNNKPQFSGFSVDDDSDHWIYCFGEVLIFALIDGKRVVILNFNSGDRVGMLKEISEGNNDYD